MLTVKDLLTGQEFQATKRQIESLIDNSHGIRHEGDDSIYRYQIDGRLQDKYFVKDAYKGAGNCS